MTRGDKASGTADGPAAVAAAFTERYRLGLAEFEKLREALAPAFALGIGQALASPARWPDVSQLLSAAVRPGARADAGDALLDLFFLSPALREAVSRQAAAMSGVAPAIVAEMMPRLAAMGTETLMRGAMERMLPHVPAGLPADDLGRLAAEMMRRGANAMEAFATPAAAWISPGATSSPFRVFDLYADAMRAALAGIALPRPASAQQPSTLDPQTSFAPFFEAFAKGMRAAAGATGAVAGTAGEKARTAKPTEPDPDLMNAFVQSGRRLQDASVREMGALFARLSPSRPSDKET